jgi:FlaG/FlaF family flagellin (archaellin)
MAASQEAILLKGDVLFNRLLNGAYQGFVDLNAGALSIKMNSKQLDAISKGRANYGMPRATAILPEPSDLTLEFNKASPKALAMGLQGSVVPFTQASGAAVDEVATSVKGGWMDMAFRNMAATGLAVKNSAGAVTYVKDTDYTVDYVAGQIFVLPTSAITDGQSLKVSYTYNAVTAESIKGGTQASVRGIIHMKGQNVFADDAQVEIKIWDAVLTSESAIDWLSEKPIDIKLKGRMVIPEGRPEPFEILTNFANA